MNHILLLEPNRENVPHLVFLMKLAETQCTVARTFDEALNWLSAARMMLTHFDLFLLNSLPKSDQESNLLEEIFEATSIPIIYVQREKSCLPQISGRDLVVCHPDDLLSCLRICLAHQKTRLKQEKVQCLKISI